MPELTYPAFLLDDQLPGGRSSGQLSFDAENLNFQADDGQHRSLALRDVSITRGGSGNRLIYFCHETQIQYSFYCSESQILNDPHLLSQPHCQRQIAFLQKKQRSALGISLLVLAIFALGIYGLFLLKSPMVGVIAQQIPPAWENKLGDLVLSQVSMGKRLIDSGEELDTFLQVAEPMLQLPAFKDRRLKFHILNDGSINAFAIPGGHVVIHTGLLQSAESWDEVMGVVGHELAHLSHRHSLRNLMDTAGLYLIVQSFLGDVQGLLAVVLNSGTQLLTLEYSRDFEREADEVGYDYITQSGFDPEGLVTFFKKIKAEQERNAMGELLNKGMEFVSTHPATDERIASMQKRIAEHQTGAPVFSPERPNYMDWRSKVLLLLPHAQPDTADSEPDPVTP